MAETYEFVQAGVAVGSGVKFGVQRYTIGADTVEFPVSIVGMFVDETTVPVAARGDVTNGLDVDVTRVPADPFGLNADAAVVAGAAGSIQAKLRLVTSQLDAMKTALELLDNAVAGTELQVDVLTLPALPTGSNTIGAVTLGEYTPAAGRLPIELDAAALAALETITVAAITAALPAGTNNIGDVDAIQSGTWTVQPGNTANTTPWLASIHDGTTKATVRDLATNDALNVAIVDATGAQITSFGGSGGTSTTDDAAFTPAVGAGTPIMGFADETAPDAVDEGDVGVVRMTLQRALHVNLRDASGAELSVGGGTQYTEDAAAAANPVGTALNLVRDDARGGSLTTADGDNVAARGTNAGELYVKHVDAIPVTDNAGSLTIDNAALAVIGGGVEAAALRVTLATDSTGVLSVDDNGGSLTIDGTVGVSGTVTVDSELTTADLDTGAGTDTRAVVGFVYGADGGGVLVSTTNPLPVGDNGGSLTVDGTVIANAGTNLNTSALALEAGGNLAGAATSLAILDDWDEADRAKVNPIAGQAGVQGGSGAVSALTQRVVLATDVALPAGTNNIGDVDVLTLPAATNAGATAKTADYDTGAGIDTVTLFGIALPASGGAAAGGTASAPVRTDPTGTTTQPVNDAGGSLTVDGTVSISGTVTVDTELPAAAALADDTGNPTVPAVGAFGMVFDGVTWDRMAGSSVDGTLVNLGGNNDVTVTGTVVDGGSSKTLKRAIVSLSADGDIVALVSTKRIKVYAYEIQSRNDSMTLQLKSSNATGTALGIRWAFNTREGAMGSAVNPPAFLFATVAGEALFADLTGTGTVDIAVSYWDDDAT